MSKIYKITTNADGSITAKVDKTVDSMVDKTVAGVAALFGGDDMAYPADVVRYGQMATNAANTIATSMFTRKRAQAGKKPIAKFLF